MSNLIGLPRDLRSLTGLRYLAATTVVVHHAAPVFAPGSPIEQFGKIGYVGVMFFFALSGFVLAWAVRPDVSKRDFYQNRIARIYPLYFATWIAAVSASFILGDDKSWIGIALSLVLLQAWVPVAEIYGAGNSPGWSLSVEAFFYALFPFLTNRRLRMHERHKLLVPTALAVAGLGIAYSMSPVYSHWLAYYSPIYNLTAFVLGILLAGAIRAGLRVRLSTWQALVIAGVVYAAISVFWPDCPRGFANAAMLLPALLVIAAGASQDVNGKRSIWATPPIVKLGQWSYALYLIHYMMVRLVERILPESFSANPLLASAAIVAFLALATSIAGLAFYAIETPAQKLLRARPKRKSAAAS